VERLRAAVHLSGAAPDQRLLADLGRALIGAGRAVEAVAALSRMLQGDLDPRARVEALTTLSIAHFATGELDRGAAALQSATSLAEHACPDAAVLPLCHVAGGLQMTAGPAAALPVADRARLLAEGAHPRLRAQTSAMRDMLAFWCGDGSGLPSLEAAGRHLLDGTEAEIADDLRSLPSGVLSPYAGTAALAGRFDRAGTAFCTGIEVADRVGAVNAGAALRIGYGVMLLGSQVRDSLVVADELLAVTELVPFAEPFARCIRSHALLELDEPEDSLAEQERAEVTVSAFGCGCAGSGSSTCKDCACSAGTSCRGLSGVLGDRAARAELGVGEPCLSRSRGTRSSPTCVPAGSARPNAAWSAWTSRPAACRAAGPGPQSRRAVPCWLSTTATTAGRRPVRLGRELLDGASLPLELAEVLIDHGTMLRRDGRPTQARDLLRRAGEVAESAGALWLARRAGEELAAAGGRRRAARAFNALTPQEQRVAQLAATGASTRVIATHLGCRSAPSARTWSTSTPSSASTRAAT
jgi:hypothetical protein